jgi:hypothetical protein
LKAAGGALGTNPDEEADARRRGAWPCRRLKATAVRVMVALARSAGVTIPGASVIAASPASSLLLFTLQ